MNIAEQINKLFETITKENINSTLDPTTIKFIGSETIGEVLEKLQILNMRVWILEDAAAKAKAEGRLTDYAELKSKIDVCFKVKRPKLMLAINKMFESMFNGDTGHFSDGSFKLYKDEADD